MVEIPKKQTGEFSLPILGLGTWRMGGGFSRGFFHDNQKDLEGIKNALASGITHIDTAEIYANGKAEELVREAIKDTDRSTIFITSKVSGEHLGYDNVIKAVKASLKRLGIQKLDMYLIHWPNSSFSLKETMRAMDFLIENELTKYVGVSNFNSQEIAEAQSYTKYKIVNNQIHYSLAARGHEEAGTLEYCRKNDILVTAYRPLEKGKLAREKVILQLAEKYKKPALAVALNWVINKPNIVALVKTSDSLHLQENLQALGWKLEKQDELELDNNFPKWGTMGVGVEP